MGIKRCCAVRSGLHILPIANRSARENPEVALLVAPMMWAGVDADDSSTSGIYNQECRALHAERREAYLTCVTDWPLLISLQAICGQWFNRLFHGPLWERSQVTHFGSPLKIGPRPIL